MDNEKIGEYLKRLRLKAGYTQADLGSYVNVTDKAISRWESGAGMPEIGNLMVLAKLFGITVDDILNCNEKVFENSAEPKPSDPGQNAQTVSPAPSTLIKENAAPTKRKNVFEDPSAKFITVLFFAYLVAGVFSVVYMPASDINLSALYVIFAVLTVLTAVMEILSAKLTSKVYGIIIITLYILLIINCLILMTFQFIYEDSMEFEKTAAYVSLVFALLFAMQLIYKVYELSGSEKLRKTLNLLAFGVSAVVLVISLASLIKNGTYMFNPYPYYASISIIFVGLTAFLFAIGQLTHKLVNIATLVIMFGTAILAIVPALYDGTGLQEQETVFRLIAISYEFPLEYLYVLAMLAPAITTVGWLFEKHDSELTAKRICSVLSFLSLIPFIVYTVDIICANAYVEYTVHIASQVMRVIILLIAIAKYVKDFKLELLFKHKGKEI